MPEIECHYYTAIRFHSTLLLGQTPPTEHFVAVVFFLSMNNANDPCFSSTFRRVGVFTVSMRSVGLKLCLYEQEARVDNIPAQFTLRMNRSWLWVRCPNRIESIFFVLYNNLNQGSEHGWVSGWSGRLQCECRLICLMCNKHTFLWTKWMCTAAVGNVLGCSRLQFDRMPDWIWSTPTGTDPKACLFNKLRTFQLGTLPKRNECRDNLKTSSSAPATLSMAWWLSKKPIVYQ